MFRLGDWKTRAFCQRIDGRLGPNVGPVASTFDVRSGVFNAVGCPRFRCFGKLVANLLKFLSRSIAPGHWGIGDILAGCVGHGVDDSVRRGARLAIGKPAVPDRFCRCPFLLHCFVLIHGPIRADR